MANNILWYQAENLNGNVLIHNGEILPLGAEYKKYFSRLDSACDKAVRNKSPWCGKVDGIFFAKGWLDTRDIQGRLLPFMFISDESDGKSALERELQSIGKKLSRDTNACFSNRKKRLSPVWLIAMAVVIIAIIAVVVLL